MDHEPSPQFRVAAAMDLPAVVAMLRNDPLGAAREDGFDHAKTTYERAFDAIAADPRNAIILAELDGEVCGCLQLTFIPGLTYTGGERAQIEGVRVSESRRGAGIGRALLDHAVERARQRGCVLVQLTSDYTRPQAIDFYLAAGFVNSHAGLKLKLK